MSAWRRPRRTRGGIAVSTGSRGDAYDNAVAQTFFATLKKEVVSGRSWMSRLELHSAVLEYIDAFYNRQRRHCGLKFSAPVTYQQLRLSAPQFSAIDRPTTINITTTHTRCHANRSRSEVCVGISSNEEAKMPRVGVDGLTINYDVQGDASRCC